MISSESRAGDDPGCGRAAGALCTLGLALGLAACGGGGDRPSPDAGDAEPTTPAVLYAERIFTPTGERFYYLAALPGVPTSPVDRTRELELSSGDPEVYNHRVFVRDRSKNTITRYKVNADLSLAVDGEVLNLGGTGLGTGRYDSAYIAPDRAYLMDSGGWRLIGWNPTTMKLTGEVISIDYMKKGDLLGAISPPVQVGSRVMAAVSWEDTDPDTLKIYPGSGLMVIDPAASGPPAFLEDPRIGGAYRVTAGASGDAFLTGITSAAIELAGTTTTGGAMPGSGILRLPAGATHFDPDYFVDVEAITGTRAVGAIHRIGDTAVLAQVYDPTAPAPTMLADLSQPQYIYVLIDTATKTAAPVTSLAKGVVGNSGNHVVDSTLYIQSSIITRTSYETTAYAVAPGGVTTAFTVSGGDLWHLERVR
jgi:hypothetical protein